MHTVQLTTVYLEIVLAEFAQKLKLFGPPWGFFRWGFLPATNPVPPTTSGLGCYWTSLLTRWVGIDGDPGDGMRFTCRSISRQTPFMEFSLGRLGASQPGSKAE